MQLFSTVASVWPTALLLLWLLSPTYAAKKRPDLNKISDPGMFILQLDNSKELPDANGEYQTIDADGYTQRNGCPNGKPIPFTEGDNYYVGCCPKDPAAHISGNTKTGLSCCSPGTDRTGSAETGYACCPPNKQVKGDVASGKYLCCDPGLEAMSDAGNTGMACCPKGTFVSGTVVDGKYLCCKAGTHRTGSESTGYYCCGEGEHVVGSDPTGYACCPLGQTISGDAKTGQYLCCGAGHERVGSPATGYACCPEGYTFEDKKCKPPKTLCTNGKQLVNGQCACPAGTTEDRKTGACVATVPDPPAPPAPAGAKTCDSGIVSGKCYQMFNVDGRIWGYTYFGCYSAFPPGEESAYHKSGKFQFCVDAACTKGIPVNPTTGFSIKDIHGIPPAGSKPNSWLNNDTGGAHITKTWDYSEAGRFSITKWPCGKYCISGAYPNGLSATCPADTVGLTFAPGDPQACIEVTLKEVPCDIRDVANNCTWKSPDDQCCGGPVDCSTSPAQAAVAPEAAKGQAAQKPVKGK